MSRSMRMSGGLVAALCVLSASALADQRQQTLKNLDEAYQGEASAAERYDLFARRADSEGLPQAAKLFRAAAKSETIHRDNHASAIQQLGGKVPEMKPEKIKVASTDQNLKSAIKDEKKDSEKTYPKFIEQAEEAGATAAVRSFESARQTEAGHVRLYTEAREKLQGMRPMDYYVNRATGVIADVPEGKKLTAAKPDQFIKVG